MLRELLLVGAGGAVGAVLRHLVTVLVGGPGAAGGAFPFATLIVNVAGSFVLGLVAALLSREAVDPIHKHLVAAGLLGALTTFSTFGVETVQLLEQEQLGKAAGSVLANVALALAAAWCGLRIGR
jgi:CrcB protein